MTSHPALRQNNPIDLAISGSLPALRREGAGRPRGQPTPKLPRKEVIQPQLPLRLPCYDFVPITGPTLGTCLPALRRG